MVPKYRQLAGRLKEEILSGALDGGRLWPERELARLHKVSRQTVRQALALLAGEGIIEKKRGSGSYAVLEPDRGRGRIVFLMPGRDCLSEAAASEIQSVCGAQGYTAQFCPTGGKIAKEREILQQLCRDPAAGICAAGSATALPNPNLDLYRRLKNGGTAFVFAGSPYRGLEDTLFVSMDNMAGGYLAVRYLMSRGHTRIACLFAGSDMQDLERYGGCVSAIRDYGLAMEEDCYLWIPDQEKRSGPDCFSGDDGFWLRAAKQISGSCGAAVCRDGRTAEQLAAALDKMRVKVPENFEILCFRDDAGPEEEMPFPSLVCAGQHPARVAVDCLLRLLAGKTVSPVRLNWRLEGAAKRGEKFNLPGPED